MKAYVLIQTQSNWQPVAGNLRELPEVSSAEDLTGAFDAIAIVRPRSTRHLIEDVIGRIRRIPGVTRALPLPVIAPPEEGATPRSDARGDPRDEAA